jgi:alanine racemase
MTHPSWIEIDLAQFEKNLIAVREKIGKRLLCLPLKANAYGHGLVRMALSAQEMGVDVIGVSCLQEGVSLRKAGITLPILVLGAIHEDQIDDLIRFNLEFSISSKFKADLVAKKGLKCRVHLEVDTGIHRTGMRPETALRLYEEMRQQPAFEIAGIYSHLATADEPDHPFVQTQIDAFAALKSQISDPHISWHIANSGGVYSYPNSYFDMVRPGLLCYGLTPDGSHHPNFHPFFTLKSQISYFKVVAPKSGISYGHLYTTQAQTRVITIPVGYGDGYPRALSNLAPILHRAKRYLIAGRICMDQFMVDIGQNEAYVGDEVTLIGDSISLWDLARLAHTDPREILCRFNDRIPRVYV